MKKMMSKRTKGKTLKPGGRARKMAASPASAFPSAPLAFPSAPGSQGPDGGPPSAGQVMDATSGGMPSGAPGGGMGM